MLRFESEQHDSYILYSSTLLWVSSGVPQVTTRSRIHGRSDDNVLAPNTDLFRLLSVVYNPVMAGVAFEG